MQNSSEAAKIESLNAKLEELSAAIADAGLANGDDSQCATNYVYTSNDDVRGHLDRGGMAYVPIAEAYASTSMDVVRGHLDRGGMAPEPIQTMLT